MMMLDHPRPVRTRRLTLLRQRGKATALKIPLHHRAPLSLYPGTELQLAFDLVANTHAGSPAVLGTTVPRHAWQHTYRVSAHLHDTPGAVHQFLTALASHGGHVLQFDDAPSSARESACHEFEALVNFGLLHAHLKTISGDLPADLTRIAAALLTADCISVLTALPQERPRLHTHRRSTTLSKRGSIKIRPARCLQRLHVLAANARVVPGTVSATGEIAIPNEWLDTLGARVGSYVVTTDTKERVLRLAFLTPDTPDRWCAIRYESQKDALPDLTRSLQKRGFNIVTALSRPQLSESTQWLELLVHPAEGAVRPGGPVRGEIRSAVHETNPRAELYFDAASVRQAAARNAGVHAWAPSVRRVTEVDDWISNTESRLDRNPGNWARKDRSDVRSAVHDVKFLTGRGNPRIFISIAYGGNDKLIEEIERACVHYECMPWIAKVPSGSRVRDSVIREIRQSEKCLCVWTMHERTTRDNKIAPSPWCVWEAGVATALGIETQFLLEDTVNPAFYSAIYADIKAETFSRESPDSFRDAVEATVSRFKGVTMAKTRRCYGDDPSGYGEADDPC